MEGGESVELEHQTKGEDVFRPGPLGTRTFTIPQATSTMPLNPPKPLLLAVPAQDGDYPVLMFLHGYMLYNSFYTQLLQHIASHGYIAIAPQMYRVIGADATGEIKDAATLTDWLPLGLTSHFPEDLQNVRPNFQKVALAGHSRGGKVAFGVALGRVSPMPSVRYSALAGLDPVDGTGKGHQTTPPILTYRPYSFDLSIPTLIVGSGLGSQSKFPFPPCAPDGVNHREFFVECCGPAYHFVPTDYGHLDLLDDQTEGIIGWFSHCPCKNGDAREPMRKFTAGILVAFLDASLRNNVEALNDIFAHPSLAPVKLERPEKHEHPCRLDWNGKDIV